MMGRMLLTEDVWQTKDGRYVGKNDPERNTLIAKEGEWIEYSDACDYGLIAPSVPAPQEPESLNIRQLGAAVIVKTDEPFGLAEIDDDTRQN